MGSNSAAPINELVSILSAIDPSKLNELRRQFPHLSSELELGRIGGAADDSGGFDLDRAEVAVRSLLAVSNKASIELVRIQARMKSSRSYRLWAQLLTLVGTSTVLGALALNKATLAVVTSVLALLASIGTVLAEFAERLIRPGKGDIYEAFEEASAANFKSRALVNDLRLAISHKVDATSLRALIGSANKQAEDLHAWVTKMTGSK